MCKWGTDIEVRVKIPADLSCNGIEKWKDALIDSCIAPIVRALQHGNIDMRGSCCGHGKFLGDIHLQDGRGLLVLSEKQHRKYITRVTKENPEGGLMALIKEVNDGI